MSYIVVQLFASSTFMWKIWATLWNTKHFIYRQICAIFMYNYATKNCHKTFLFYLSQKVPFYILFNIYVFLSVFDTLATGLVNRTIALYIERYYICTWWMNIHNNVIIHDHTSIKYKNYHIQVVYKGKTIFNTLFPFIDFFISCAYKVYYTICPKQFSFPFLMDLRANERWCTAVSYNKYITAGKDFDFIKNT